ncbi:Hypothetical protein CINCED_3A020885 [Cinara cedri]|nr:Hypothetical protein CINCED_3A020885 [Cinara cedri]
MARSDIAHYFDREDLTLRERPTTLRYLDSFWGSWGISRSADMPSVEELEQHFCEHFHSFQPEYYVQVPGKVNLIGDHIDYSGYSALPMAIEQSIVVAIGRSEGNPTVWLTNLNSERYKNVNVKIADITADTFARKKCWANYFLCGVKGAREITMNIRKLRKMGNTGFLFAISSSIPEDSGLGCSSALITAGMLSALVGYDVHCYRLGLALDLAMCESFAGQIKTNPVNSSGLNQAIAMCARQGYAARINFDPLEFEQYRLPSDVKFVIAQSLAIKNNLASDNFNTRKMECRLASQIIAKQLNLEWKNLTVLATLQENSGNTLDQMIELVHQHLHVNSYSRNEICEILSVEATTDYNTKDVTEFFLHQRALHVFEEAKRLETFCSLCETPGTASDLGRLMDESHSSLRDLYQCSHPDLDELVDVCKRGHAYGCKLTGAGWGGCVVAMVPSVGVDEFIEFIKDQFYAKKNTGAKCFAELIFVANPSEGASLFLAPNYTDNNNDRIEKKNMMHNRTYNGDGYYT